MRHEPSRERARQSTLRDVPARTRRSFYVRRRRGRAAPSDPLSIILQLEARSGRTAVHAANTRLMGRGRRDASARRRRELSAAAAAAVRGPTPVLAEQPPLRDELEQELSYAAVVARLIDLAGGSLDPMLVNPLALILREEGLLEMDGVSFGSDYALRIRSNELERGYTVALCHGWLRPEDGRATLTGSPAKRLAVADAAAKHRVGELTKLSRVGLTAAARPLLLSR